MRSSGSTRRSGGRKREFLRRPHSRRSRSLLRSGRGAEAHGGLAVRNLSCRTGVLPLNADRVLALFQEPGVVDDPRGDGFTALHRGDGVPQAGWLRDRQVALPPSVRTSTESQLFMVTSEGAGARRSGWRRPRDAIQHLRARSSEGGWVKDRPSAHGTSQRASPADD